MWSHCSKCLWDQVATTQAGKLPRRTFSQKPMLREELEHRAQAEADAMLLDPRTVHTFKQEKQLKKFRRLLPIGSRRRRIAMASTDNVPFHNFPTNASRKPGKFLRSTGERFWTKLLRIARARGCSAQAGS